MTGYVGIGGHPTNSPEIFEVLRILRLFCTHSYQLKLTWIPNLEPIRAHLSFATIQSEFEASTSTTSRPITKIKTINTQQKTYVFECFWYTGFLSTSTWHQLLQKMLSILSNIYNYIYIHFPSPGKQFEDLLPLPLMAASVINGVGVLNVIFAKFAKGTTYWGVGYPISIWNQGWTGWDVDSVLTLCICGLLSLLSKKQHIPLLVGGFNPSEKYARQIGNFLQFSGWISENKKYLTCHHLVFAMRVLGSGKPRWSSILPCIRGS